MDLVKLLQRSKLLQSWLINIPYSSSSSTRFYHSRRFAFTNEDDQSSIRHRVGIFWDLDNKSFPIPATMAAYANRHSFTFLPDWVRAQRRQRKALDILESDGIIRARDPYVCEVCGRRFETNIKFQKHFKQLHEREHHKRLARLESLKGKKKDFFRAKIGPKEEKYRAAAKEVLLPKEGYGLAGELKRAGFCVRTVRDRPQVSIILMPYCQLKKNCTF